jgi:hypothetical protein
MTQASTFRRKYPVLEIFGMLLCGIGLSLAVGYAVVACSDEQLAKEKQQVATKMDDMRSALISAKVPAEQIPGLLQIHKASLTVEATHEHFILLLFFTLLHLLVASAGLTIVLWAKLRAFTSEAKIRSNAPIAV